MAGSPSTRVVYVSAESFMNELQQEYFRRKLADWREELLEDYEETRTSLSGAERQAADFVIGNLMPHEDGERIGACFPAIGKEDDRISF